MAGGWKFGEDGSIPETVTAAADEYRYKLVLLSVVSFVAIAVLFWLAIGSELSWDVYMGVNGGSSHWFTEYYFSFYEKVSVTVQFGLVCTVAISSASLLIHFLKLKLTFKRK